MTVDTLDRDSTRDLASDITATLKRNRPSVVDTVLLDAFMVGLDSGDIRAALLDHLAAVSLLIAEHTGAARPSTKAEAAVRAAASREDAAVAALLMGRLDELTALLGSAVRS